jgi:hypothetical protein
MSICLALDLGRTRQPRSLYAQNTTAWQDKLSTGYGSQNTGQRLPVIPGVCLEVRTWVADPEACVEVRESSADPGAWDEAWGSLAGAEA